MADKPKPPAKAPAADPFDIKSADDRNVDYLDRLMKGKAYRIPDPPAKKP